MRGNSIRKLTKYTPATNDQKNAAAARTPRRPVTFGSPNIPATEIVVANISNDPMSTVDETGIRPSTDPIALAVSSAHVTRPLMGKGVCHSKGLQKFSRKTISFLLAARNFPREVA